MVQQSYFSDTERNQQEMDKNKKDLAYWLAERDQSRAGNVLNTYRNAKKLEGETNERTRKEARQQLDQDTNWLDEGLTGASLGTTVNPGWGTAIGGVAGAVLGIIKGFNARKEANPKEKDWDALSKVLFNVKGMGRGENLTAALPLVAKLGQEMRGKWAEDKSPGGTPDTYQSRTGSSQPYSSPKLSQPINSYESSEQIGQSVNDPNAFRLRGVR